MRGSATQRARSDEVALGDVSFVRYNSKKEEERL